MFLIEEYIDGRELYLSVLGNHRLTVFPTREIFFEQVPEDTPKFATYHAKWNEKYREKWGINNGPAKPLPDRMPEIPFSVSQKSLPPPKDPGLRQHRRALLAQRRSLRDRSQSQPIVSRG